MRCLIIDDSAQFGEVARVYLERQGVNVVAVATSGAEGVARTCELRPDVALVDVDLGDESGFDVARSLTELPCRPHPSVILISAQDPRDYAELIEASPAIGFITKLELSWESIEALLRAGR